ncbi:hypothetical protein LTR06_010335 [Exophiala xenobiotica]|nr:hypothetical protein LTR06_010335 [Exophiala xenobiotica]
MERTVLGQRDRFQLSYELPHQVHTSHVYPRQSSNGSTVIIYGHEEGLRIVWFAGKAFKPATKVAAAPKVNGTAKGDAVVIDLDDDDEEPSTKGPPTAPAEFQEEDEEIDPTAPYRDVMRYVDIPLGTAAMRIAVPHTVKDPEQAPPDSWPSLYLDRIVVAVACADLSIRVISASLDPPAPEVQDVSRLDIQSIKIFGPSFHQDFISDIAVTHTTGIQDDDQEDNKQQQASDAPSKQKSSTNARQWSLLIATISCTGAGLLLIHQIPIQGNSISPAPEHFLPIRRHYLRSSAISARLSFNPCPFPAERHSNLLVTLPSASCVKLYQVFPTYPRERRGSTGTADSVSTTRSTRTSGSSRGKFLMGFLPPFVQETGTVTPRRKGVLDARWVAGGRAVIALLEDGEWGIWDLEAVGPTSSASSSGANLIRGQANIAGIHGGSLTKFAVRSKISPPVEARQKTSGAETQPSSGSLAPMTPSTRKLRSEGLFNGDKRQASIARSQTQHGSIYVEDKASGRPQDECAVISYGEENIYVSSLYSFWKSDIKPTRLPAVNLGGLPQRCFSLLPTSNNDSNSPSSALFGMSTSTPEFLIQTDHRLILSVNPLTEPATITSSAVAETTFSLGPEASDQALLASGELDVDGMERILEEMGGGNDAGAALSKPKPMNIFTKSVGFQLDDHDDEDVDMASPTPAKYSSLKPRDLPRFGAGTRNQGSQRRIFS